MSGSDNPFLLALGLIASFDGDLGAIVGLSLAVSFSAVALGSVVGLPLGAAVAMLGFPGRRLAVVTLNAFMGLPPVVIGLVCYLVLSRSGPLGGLGFLFTPSAMIIAQWILVTPIIAAIARQIVEDLWLDYREQLISLGATPLRAIPTLLIDARHSLATAVLAGFGRASAEVGAVMIVGGNIEHETRVMTTTIVLETTKGNLPLALALGLVLIALSLAVNGAAHWLRDIKRAERMP